MDVHPKELVDAPLRLRLQLKEVTVTTVTVTMVTVTTVTVTTVTVTMVR